MANIKITAFFFVLSLVAFASCAPSTSSTTDGPHNVTPQYQQNLSTVFSFGTRIDTSKANPLASDFSWKDSLGIKHSLSELQGKVVLLNFWAIWCTYCLDEMPALQDIQKREAADSVVVIGVSIDGGATPFKDDFDFINFKNFKYQMLVDANQDIYRNYSLENAIPQTFLIDRDGTISRYFGHEYSEKDYLDAIDAIK